jgi:hypothetical protein
LHLCVAEGDVPKRGGTTTTLLDWVINVYSPVHREEDIAAQKSKISGVPVNPDSVTINIRGKQGRQNPCPSKGSFAGQVDFRMMHVGKGEFTLVTGAEGGRWAARFMREGVENATWAHREQMPMLKFSEGLVNEGTGPAGLYLPAVTPQPCKRAHSPGGHATDCPAWFSTEHHGVKSIRPEYCADGTWNLFPQGAGKKCTERFECAEPVPLCKAGFQLFQLVGGFGQCMRGDAVKAALAGKVGSRICPLGYYHSSRDSPLMQQCVCQGSGNTCE